MRIYYIHNDDDLKILRTANVPVTDFKEVVNLLDEMFELMHKTHGVGLAAPQVGINKRFFITEVEEGNRLVFINPEIIETSLEETLCEEGCLSVPGLYEKVKRPSTIKVQAYNEKGRPFSLEASGFLATCIQHENDHLKGKLFIDYFSEKKQVSLIKKYEKNLAKLNLRD